VFVRAVEVMVGLLCGRRIYIESLDVDNIGAVEIITVNYWNVSQHIAKKQSSCRKGITQLERVSPNVDVRGGTFT
jgi:hypothetical protein